MEEDKEDHLTISTASRDSATITQKNIEDKNYDNLPILIEEWYTKRRLWSLPFSTKTHNNTESRCVPKDSGNGMIPWNWQEDLIKFSKECSWCGSAVTFEESTVEITRLVQLTCRNPKCNLNAQIRTSNRQEMKEEINKLICKEIFDANQKRNLLQISLIVKFGIRWK